MILSDPELLTCGLRGTCNSQVCIRLSLSISVSHLLGTTCGAGSRQVHCVHLPNRKSLLVSGDRRTDRPGAQLCRTAVQSTDMEANRVKGRGFAILKLRSCKTPKEGPPPEQYRCMDLLDWTRQQQQQLWRWWVCETFH